MRRKIVILLGLLACIEGWSQSSHTIQRGETFELIAKRYNMPVGELMAANLDVDRCYAGMKLNIPEGRTISETITTVTSAENSLLDAASDYLKAGKYRKAASIYSDILKNTQTAYAYYGRGISYFNREKYKSAMEDLRAAKNCPDCTDEIREHCKSLISEAESLREEQHRRRNQLWGGITLAVAQTAATIYVASEQQKAQQAYNNTSSSRYSGSSSSLSRTNAIIAQSDANINQMMANSNAQLNQMTQQMLLQAQMGKERMQESMNEELKWRGEFAKKYGREPTEYEVDQWYSSHYPDLLEYRIQARANNMRGESDNSRESGESTSQQDRPQKSSHKCSACNGTGSIVRNDGTIPSYGAKGFMKKCSTCGDEYWSTTFHRHETCRICHGKGSKDY